MTIGGGEYSSFVGILEATEKRLNAVEVATEEYEVTERHDRGDIVKIAEQVGYRALVIVADVVVGESWSGKIGHEDVKRANDTEEHERGKQG